MAKPKAPIYKSNEEVVNKELLDQLYSAVELLRDAMIPSIPINHGGLQAGFGVSKAQRSIAADNVIAIARQIKAKPGW